MDRFNSNVPCILDLCEIVLKESNGHSVPLRTYILIYIVIKTESTHEPHTGRAKNIAGIKWLYSTISYFLIQMCPRPSAALDLYRITKPKLEKRVTRLQTKLQDGHSKKTLRLFPISRAHLQAWFSMRHQSKQWCLSYHPRAGISVPGYWLSYFCASISTTAKHLNHIFTRKTHTVSAISAPPNTHNSHD